MELKFGDISLSEILLPPLVYPENIQIIVEYNWMQCKTVHTVVSMQFHWQNNESAMDTLPFSVKCQSIIKHIISA